MHHQRLREALFLLEQSLQHARAAGLRCQERHLAKARRALQAALDTPEPADVRQRFFAAMLEAPSVLRT